MSDEGKILEVRLDRPEVANAIDHEVLDGLEAALTGGDAAAVILSAAPGPVFSAGGDLRLGAAELARLSDRVYDLCRACVTSATIFIVAVDGLAVGSGAQLMLAADLRVIGPGARLRVAAPQRGLVAGAWSLPGHVGRSRALRLLLLGEDLEAAQLADLGLAEGIDAHPDAAARSVAEWVARLDRDVRERAKLTVGAASIALEAMRLEQLSFRPPAPLSDGAR